MTEKMPPKWPDRKNEVRCKWFNDVGWPRVNPEKQRLGYSVITGCIREDSVCHFAHPGEGIVWSNAKLARQPTSKDYPDGIVPRTPTPPWPGSTRNDSKFSHIKQEGRSPPHSSLFLDTSKSASHHSRPQSRIDSHQHSPMQSRNNRSYNSNRDSYKDYHDSGNRRASFYQDNKQEAGRGRNLGHSKEREWDRRKSFSDYRKRDRTPSRDVDRTDTQPTTPVTPYDKHQSTGRYSTSDNSKSRMSPIDLTVKDSSKDNENSQDHDISMNGKDSTAPLIPSQFPPSSRRRESSIASSAAGPPPSTAVSTAMPPPETPFSATSTMVNHAPPTFPAFPIHELPKKEVVSDEDSYKIWDKRIELLGEAVLARRELKKNLEELKYQEALSDSSRVSSLSLSTKEKIVALLKATELKCKASRARAELAHKQICALDFWPVRRPINTLGENNEANDKRLEEENERILQDEHREVKKEVGELGDMVSRLDRQLKEVITFVTSSSRPGMNDSTFNPNTTAATAIVETVDVESIPDRPRGVKRRKTGDGENAYVSDTGSVSIQHQTPVDIQTQAKEDKTVSHQLKKLESQYGELENLFNLANDNENDEILGIVDNELEKMQETLKRNLKKERKVIIQTEERFHSGLRDKIAALKGEMNSLAAQANPTARVADKQHFRDEFEQLCEAVKESKQRTDELAEQIRANTEEARVLRRLVELAHQPPQNPSIDELVEAILPRVMDTVRDEMEERFLRHREEIIKLLRERAPQYEALTEGVSKFAGLPEAFAILQSSGMFGGDANGSGNSRSKNSTP